MIGSSLHIASTLLTLASASACPVVPGPDIAVRMVREPTVIRQDLDKSGLGKMTPNTKLPHQMQDMSHVEIGGMMRDDIGISYDIRFTTTPGNTAETINDFCVRYKSIVVTLTLKPTIFIASDYAPGTCWYHQVREHEESHIDMDEIVVEKYIDRIKDGLNLAFAKPEDFIEGPVREKGIQNMKRGMGRAVMAMVDVLSRDLARERQEKQQAVDSLRGYAHIMNACYTGPNVFRPNE